MRIVHLLPITAALAAACGAPPDEPATASEEPLTITNVHLSKSGAPQIEVVTETRAERALRLSPPNAAGREHANIYVASACPPDIALELCDDPSPGCSTGHLACIWGTPEDSEIALTSIPRWQPVICRKGQCPPPLNFYQHVVQYRPNQVGPLFENRRFPWFAYCTESAIDDPWWVRAGSCASSQANLLGINCLASGSQFTCTYDSDCCGLGAYCSAGTCQGGT